MARETRGNGKAADVAATTTAATPAKRKRGASPVAASTSSKTTQQSSTSLSGGGTPTGDSSKGPSIKLNLGRNKDAAAAESSSQASSPEKATNGDAAPVKKQKISLKTSAAGAAGVSNPKGEAQAGDRSEEPVNGRILPSDVREALALIMPQMATGLPAPMDKILSLWLPPTFKQEEQNTLGFILKQDHLTFEKLVDVIHLFAENLLEPCAYPNPMPPLSRLHLPSPILPSHLYPHAIYNFCAALHPLMLRIEPSSDAEGGGEVPTLRADEADTERWALVQKIPGPRGESASEWFTAMVNGKEVAALAKTSEIDGNEDGGVVARLAGEGRHFGYAQPLLVQTAIAGPSRSKPSTLADSVIRKASVKAQRWKEALERQRGHFGSIAQGVTIPEVSNSEWTPTFGPLYDSTHASGGRGYWSTLDAMHQAAKLAAYRQQAGEQIKLGREGWNGSIEAKNVADGGEDVFMEGAESPRSGTVVGKPKDVDEILKDNAALLAELREWQHVRVLNGQGNWVTERENLIAEEVSETLSRLAESVTPADLLSHSMDAGAAHELSKRIIHGSAPSLRGTLDPRRPRALHDNATVRLRPAPLSSVSSISPLPGTGSGANLAGLSGPRPGGGGPPYPTGAGAGAGAAARYPNYRPPAPGHVSATPQRMAGPAYYPSPAGSAPASAPYGARAPGLPQTPGTAYGYGQTPGGPSGGYAARPGPTGMSTPGATGGPAGGSYGARNAPGPGPSGLRQPYPGGRLGY